MLVRALLHALAVVAASVFPLGSARAEPAAFETTSAAPASVEDWERRAPTPDAPAHKPFAWTSKGELRYAWCLPKGYDAKQPRNLTVILHGTGLDYRWGFWNNKPGDFRPDDIVVSVDGPTPDGEARLFLGDDKNAKAFREFLKELRASFSVDRIFLYGHSQGGFFVVYFAGEYPDEVAGVVAHASGAWNWSKTGKPVQKVAIAFMHGTQDPVVPYGQSPGSRDAYAELGFPRLHLRRLQQYNHWPNATRANECLAWCQGMTTTRPEEALACVRELLRPKGSDEYQWETVADFSGARDVLRRFSPKGVEPFKDAAPELTSAAETLVRAIEDEGARHVAELKSSLPKKLALDGKPWLGHLIALREDFRGVDSVEAFVTTLGYDKLVKAQSSAAGAIFRAWYDENDEKKQFETIVEKLGDAFLVEGYPPELAKRLKELEGRAKQLKLSKAALTRYADVEKWRTGWNEGLRAYESLWRKWKGVSGR